MKMNRWMSSRAQLKMYTLGFLSGTLLVYTLSQIDHLYRIEDRTQKDLVAVLSKSKFNHDSRALSMRKILGDVLDDDVDDGGDIIFKTSGESIRAKTSTEINVMRPGYLDEPIDPHEYNYIHNPSNMCFNQNGARLNVIVLFMSLTAPDHFARRESIRATYGNSSQWDTFGKKRSMRTVFLLGATSNATLQRWIDLEAEHHGDIIQEDFVDSYMNLTRKTVMGLKWATHHCRHARYAMKIDDDTMMNQRRFRDIVLRDAPTTNYTAAKALIGTPTIRKKSSKFYLSEEYYPHPTYPPYMDGPAYLLSLDLVEQAYEAALTTPLFKWEDAFVGMCLQKAGAKVNGFDRFLLFKISKRNNEEQRANKARAYIFVSNLNAKEMRWMWELCHV